jgi:hypothetical protein
MEQEHFSALSALGDRLQSLQHTLETSEERWRKRGDGMRGSMADEQAENAQSTAGV